MDFPDEATEVVCVRGRVEDKGMVSGSIWQKDHVIWEQKSDLSANPTE